MNIAFDTRWIFEKISGIGRYAQSLIQHFSQIDSIDNYILLFNDEKIMQKQYEKLGLKDKRNFRLELLSYSIFSPRNQIWLPSRLNRLQVDVFHSPSFMIPLRRFKGKIITTFHDLIPLMFPHYTPRAKKKKFFWLYKWVIRRAAKVSDAIITGSQNTKKDIIQHLNAKDEKVEVIPYGIDPNYFMADSSIPIDFLKRRFGISGKIILAVGREDPYKNILGLAKAFEKLISAGKHNYYLVLVGEKDERYPEVRNFVMGKGLSQRILFTGYLEEDKLVNAYREADVFVHPALYEGFGFPPLEAMACGTPVISSDRASLPEVLDEAAIFIEPTDINALAQTIDHLLTHPELQDYLRQKGIERARIFNWKITAEKVLQLYHRIDLSKQ